MSERGALSVRIVGRGRVGRGLARALRAVGARVDLVSTQRAARGESAITLITTPDPAIAPAAASIASALTAGAVVLHCSGSLGPDVLAPCRAAGVHTGVMHPLASFADPKRPPDLRGAAFVIAGDAAAVRAATRIARAIGARPLVAAVHGPAYHAAAALAANGAAALAAVAVRILARVGFEQRDAERAIGALVRTVGENVANVGVPHALSGPVIRGDAATVRVHREALHDLDDDARAAYDAVAPAILDCAERAGLSSERASAVRRALRSRAKPTR